MFERRIGLVLNSPRSLLGFLYGLLSLPKNFKVDKARLVVAIGVRKLWLIKIFIGRDPRGLTLGNIVLLAQTSDDIYKHETVHVNQFLKMPLIFPIIYLVESAKKGYHNNQYEVEVRRR